MKPEFKFAEKSEQNFPSGLFCKVIYFTKMYSVKFLHKVIQILRISIKNVLHLPGKE